MNNFFKKGITIVEILIVLAVVILIAAIAVPSFSKLKQVQVLKNSVEDIISASNKAKSETLASLDSSNYGVHFQANKVVIFKGIFYNQDDANNRVVDIISPAVISGISLSGGGTDVYFNKLTGAPNKTGTITISISSDANLTKTLTISATGSISSN